jgi:hypothetical protein
MDCIGCGSAAVSDRSECTAQGYRRFRCRACGKQFNERSAGSLNRTQYPSDVIALVVLWRLRYKLGLHINPVESVHVSGRVAFWAALPLKRGLRLGRGGVGDSVALPAALADTAPFADETPVPE